MMSYDEAVKLIERSGISADPTDELGSYVCDLLDEYADEYNQFSSRSITKILGLARKQMKLLDEDSSYSKGADKYDDIHPGRWYEACSYRNYPSSATWQPFVECLDMTKSVNKVTNFIDKNLSKGLYVEVSSYETRDSFFSEDIIYSP